MNPSKALKTTVILLTLFFNQTIAQTLPAQQRAITTTDTIWGNGLVITRNAETNEKVPYVNLEFTPDTMIMVTPDTTYDYQTDYGGLTHYNLPVGIDIQDGIEENKNKGSQLKVYPNPANGFNLTTHNDTPLQSVAVYSLSGQLVQQITPQNPYHTFVDLSSRPNGIYVYRAITRNNRMLTGKFVKNNMPSVKFQYSNNKFQTCLAGRQVNSNKEISKTKTSPSLTSPITIEGTVIPTNKSVIPSKGVVIPSEARDLPAPTCPSGKIPINKTQIPNLQTMQQCNNRTIEQLNN